jgi:hypothetical protein
VETKTWEHVDKSGWPDGPWNGEPDKMQWTDETTGLPCLIKRHARFGNLCGYVGVTEDHPWYRKDHDAVDASVHGGLTYSDFCMEEGDEAETICHIPAPGEPDNVWWLGFDCGHAWDRQPGVEADYASVWPAWKANEIYRDVAYVKAECADLAKQAKEAA